MIPLRIARELTYQLEKAGEDERLARVLASVHVFFVLYSGDEVSDYLALWQRLSTSGRLPILSFSESLNELRISNSKHLVLALQKMNSFFDARSEFEHSQKVLAELKGWANANSDSRQSMIAELGLGSLNWRLSKFEEAKAHYDCSLELAESLGEQGYIARSIGNLGLVLMDLGQYAEAIDCFQRRLALEEAAGNRHGIAGAIGNIGLVHMDQGRFDEAIICLEQDLQLSTALGDRQSMCSAAGNLGIVYMQLSRYSEALKCYEQQYELAKLLGYKSGMKHAVGNMGLVQIHKGAYSQAVLTLNQQLELAEQLGDHRARYIAMGNLATVHLKLGRHEEALRANLEALEGHRAIGFKFGMSFWLIGIAEALLHSAFAQTGVASSKAEMLQKARDNAEECIRLSQDLSKPDTVFESQILLARIDHAEGRVARAVERLEALASEADDEEQLAETHYWLWKSQDSESGRTHAIHATSLLEKLHLSTGKFEYRKRIAELRGERVPMSADDLAETPA